MGYPATRGQVLRACRAGMAAALLSLPFLAASSPSLAAPPSCEEVVHDGVGYTVCIADLSQSDLRLFWSDATGTPYRTFRAVDAALAGEGLHLSFAMNAGMFNEAYGPVGLYVERGAELHAANTNEGPGNFHLMPNGIFWWGEGVAGVTETNRYVANPPPALYATQSGPMLLIDGAVHPRFLVDSSSRKIRNGVGIVGENTVAFVLSHDGVTFYDFALFFRDELGARDALYLDGSVSSIYAPQLDRQGGGWFGPILGIVER
ncbi:MAG: phosphodiester glycosidase family protein [Bauldia sp.]|nr:phosphodiester glycosidase family protein [Bauldia sp.]